MSVVARPRETPPARSWWIAAPREQFTEQAVTERQDRRKEQRDGRRNG